MSGDTRLVSEVHRMPPSRPEVVKEVERLLNLGGVQKMVLTAGKDIVVNRLVPTQEGDLPAPSAEDDLSAVLRHTDIQQFEPPAKWPAAMVMMLVFLSATQQGLSPQVLLVRTEHQLKAWMKVEGVQMSTLYGVQVRSNKDTPDDVLLVVCSPSGDPDMLTTTIRVPMGLPFKELR